MGLSLELPSPSAGDLVTAILPQVQDAIRQTVLGFKSDDLQTPEGLEKVRAAMIADLNRTLLTRSRRRADREGEPRQAARVAGHQHLLSRN